MHTHPLSRGEPIVWGAIKIHCTAMDSVAANRRLSTSQQGKEDFSLIVEDTSVVKFTLCPAYAFIPSNRVAADVWKKDVWEFQAKFGSSGSCRLFLDFLGKIKLFKRCLEKRLEVPDILLPDIRGLLIQIRAFSSLAPSHPCTPASSPGLARPRPALAHSRFNVKTGKEKFTIFWCSLFARRPNITIGDELITYYIWDSARPLQESVRGRRGPNIFLGWPRSTLEKGPHSDESYEKGKALETVPFQPYFGCTKTPQSTVKLVLPSNEIYESKTGCNRTLATVPWVPLNFKIYTPPAEIVTELICWELFCVMAWTSVHRIM